MQSILKDFHSLLDAFQSKTLQIFKLVAGVAQLVRAQIVNMDVEGSSPSLAPPDFP